MLKQLANRIIQKLGRDNYTLYPALSSNDLFWLLFRKMVEAFRGLFIKPFLGGSKGVLFLGRRVRLRHKSHLYLGRSAQIGDNVEINALSRDRVHIGDNFSLHRNCIIECTGVIRNL